MKYYIIQSALKREKIDFIRLGKRIRNSKGFSKGFGDYKVNKILVNNNFQKSWYDKYKEIEVLENKILEFENNNQAMLWFKLNY